MPGTDVQGHLVHSYSEAKNPGDFWFSENQAGQIARLMFLCPCGAAGEVAGVAVARDMADRGGNHPLWSWNGNRKAPTLTPSIQRLDGCRWHGYLTDGVFKPV